jgi:hypothetical protein
MTREQNPAGALRIFTVGQRVAIEPWADLWMRGAKYARIERVGRKGVMTIRLEGFTPARHRVHASCLTPTGE